MRKELNKSQTYVVLIVGGGPAGIAATYLCHNRGLSYLLIESGKGVFQLGK